MLLGPNATAPQCSTFFLTRGLFTLVYCIDFWFFRSLDFGFSAELHLGYIGYLYRRQIIDSLLIITFLFRSIIYLDAVFPTSKIAVYIPRNTEVYGATTFALFVVVGAEMANNKICRFEWLNGL